MAILLLKMVNNCDFTMKHGETWQFYNKIIVTCETRVQEKNAMDNLGLKKHDGKQKLR